MHMLYNFCTGIRFLVCHLYQRSFCSRLNINNIIMSSGFEDRLKQLESIETDIALVVQQAGKVILELSKDRPAEKQIDSNTKTFAKTLEAVEKRLMEQINYLSQVSTGQPHEGSSYSAQKEAQMAIHRLEHAKTKLMEIKKTLTVQ